MSTFYKSVCTPSIFEVRDDGTVWVRHRYGWAKLDNTGEALGWWKEISAAEAADYGKENVSNKTPKEPERPKYWLSNSLLTRQLKEGAIFEYLSGGRWIQTILSTLDSPITPTQAEAIIKGDPLPPVPQEDKRECHCAECDEQVYEMNKESEDGFLHLLVTRIEVNLRGARARNEKCALELTNILADLKDYVAAIASRKEK